jgi:hypothetical protein
MTAAEEAANPLAVALEVTRALDDLGIASTIGGSIASSYVGEPRSTIAIDIVAAIEERHVADIAAALSHRFYVDEDALRRAARDRATTNLIHQPTMIKVDLFVAGGTPLDAQQIARRRTVSLGDGRTIAIHPPEDILLQKLRCIGSAERCRIGNGVTSPGSSGCRDAASTWNISGGMRLRSTSGSCSSGR